MKLGVVVAVIFGMGGTVFTVFAVADAAHGKWGLGIQDAGKASADFIIAGMAPIALPVLFARPEKDDKKTPPGPPKP